MSCLLDLYSLASEVLDGEDDTHFILADLLEECGHRHLARRALDCGCDRRLRLEFVLGLLPCFVCLRLGCEFYARFARRYQSWDADGALANIRRWTFGKATVRDLRRASSFLIHIPAPSYAPTGEDRAAIALGTASLFALKASRSEHNGDPCSSGTYAEKSRSRIREVVSASRQMPQGLFYAEELRWQVERVQCAISRILIRVETQPEFLACLSGSLGSEAPVQLN